MDEVATNARRFGLNWASSRVGAIEDGRFKPTLDTLAVLALALTRDGDREPVAVGDLVAGEDLIELTPKVAVTSESLVTWLAGGNLEMRADTTTAQHAVAKFSAMLDGLRLPPRGRMLPADRVDTYLDMVASITPGEERLAHAAGIDPVELRAWAMHLWREPVEKRRDTIAGPGVTPQKKGHVSRELLTEITDAMRAEHGDD